MDVFSHLKVLVIPIVSLLVAGCCHSRGDAYFPYGYFVRETDDWGSMMLETGPQGWDQGVSYAKMLRGMKEPSLFNPYPTTTPCYRFLWLRTFHPPYAIRVVTCEEGGGLLHVKRCDGQGGFEPGRLAEDRVVALSSDTMADIHRRVMAAGFWSVPKRYPPTHTDGSIWVLEVADILPPGLKSYRVVERHSPVDFPEFERSKEFIDLCEFFLKLAKVEVPEDDYY